MVNQQTLANSNQDNFILAKFKEYYDVNDVEDYPHGVGDIFQGIDSIHPLYIIKLKLLDLYRFEYQEISSFQLSIL